MAMGGINANLDFVETPLVGVSRFETGTSPVSTVLFCQHQMVRRKRRHYKGELVALDGREGFLEMSVD